MAGTVYNTAQVTAPDHQATLDDVADIAARALACAIAVVSLAGRDRLGLEPHARLGGAAVLRDDPGGAGNAGIDPHAVADPRAARRRGLLFYAGVPLRSDAGYDLGVLAVADRTPRAVSGDELAILKKLARLVVRHLEVQLDLGLASRAVTPAA